MRRVGHPTPHAIGAPRPEGEVRGLVASPFLVSGLMGLAGRARHLSLLLGLLALNVGPTSGTGSSGNATSSTATSPNEYE